MSATSKGYLVERRVFMQVMSASALVRLREQLDITREDIVRRSHVSVATVRNAEKGLKITRRSALQILHAVNSHLRERSQPEVTLDDLDFVL
jgi:DNA-binding transcriptional regulator YiaG